MKPEKFKDLPLLAAKMFSNIGFSKRSVLFFEIILKDTLETFNPMKKLSVFMFLLFISSMPVVGKSNHENCLTEKLEKESTEVLDEETNSSYFPGRTESLLTHLLYTL